jgi:hypothetical protein
MIEITYTYINYLEYAGEKSDVKKDLEKTKSRAINNI